jgi:hypothetical protein
MLDGRGQVSAGRGGRAATQRVLRPIAPKIRVFPDAKLAAGWFSVENSAPESIGVDSALL